MNGPTAVVALTAAGGVLAKRIAENLESARTHGLAGRVVGSDVAFEHTAAHLRSLFAAGESIVAVLAAGIAVRALAPVLGDKRGEPPVVVVSEDGTSVVPLLGGHRGANALARKLANILDAHAAITTTGDRRFGVALDQPPAGYTLANAGDCKSFVAGLLSGTTVRVRGEAHWLDAATFAREDTGPFTISITDRRESGAADHLVYHPSTLGIGVGCERGTDPAEVIGLVRETLESVGLAEAAVAGVYSVDLKADEPAVHALAESLGVGARFFAPDVLEAQAARLANPSDIVFREVGCHGVAEGAALAAAGPEAVLTVEKRKSRHATCAVARAPGAFDGRERGIARGRLRVVGVGPGAAIERTAKASAALRAATHWVGYRLYLDLIEDLRTDQTLRGYELGQEAERVRLALSLAAEGHDVALVCSGDPGIYAMASLVFETLDDSPPAPWRRIEVEVVPGVSALQVAAARAGAPIGHDFCAISLSDLLTPREVIERRVLNAARGDFVVAFYNPVSRERRIPFERALAVLREHRSPDTPVVLGHSLGRAQEHTEIIRLAELNPDRIDMLTVVLVGSSETRTLSLGDSTRAYTPRGYAAKQPAPPIAREGSHR